MEQKIVVGSSEFLLGCEVHFDGSYKLEGYNLTHKIFFSLYPNELDLLYVI